MKILYIDTVTEWMVTGIVEIQNGIVDKKSLSKERVPREGGLRLPVRIEEHLKFMEIRVPDRILVVHGPGSFTGIRIGLAFAKTYSQVLGIPVMGVNSLEVYCMYYYNIFKERIVVLLDGRMKKVYGGAYSENGFEGPFDLPPEEAKIKLDLQNSKGFSDFSDSNCIGMGSDFPDPLYYIEKNIEKILNCKLSEWNWKNLNPLYLRGTYVDR